ncbi:unnamed protein product, partial [Vitrella brassicaformis CCMP3155]
VEPQAPQPQPNQQPTQCVLSQSQNHSQLPPSQPTQQPLPNNPQPVPLPPPLALPLSVQQPPDVPLFAAPSHHNQQGQHKKRGRPKGKAKGKAHGKTQINKNTKTRNKGGAAKKRAPRPQAPAAALVAVKTEPTDDEPPRPTRDNDDVPSLFRRRLSATLLDSVEWVCGVCGSDSERQSCLVLCEGSGSASHLSCLTPPLTRPPSGDFICNDCVQRKGLVCGGKFQRGEICWCAVRSGVSEPCCVVQSSHNSTDGDTYQVIAIGDTQHNRVCASSGVMVDWEQGLARWQRMPTRTQEADTQRLRGVSDAIHILAGTKTIHDIIIANKPTSGGEGEHRMDVAPPEQPEQPRRNNKKRPPSRGLSVVSPRSNNNKRRRHRGRRPHRSDSPADSLIDRSVVGESAKALIARVPPPTRQPLCHIASTKPQPHRDGIGTLRRPPTIIKNPITIKPRTQQAQPQQQPAPHPHNKPAVIKAAPAADADAAVQRQSKKPSQPRPPINKNDHKKGREDGKQHKQQEQPNRPSRTTQRACVLANPQAYVNQRITCKWKDGVWHSARVVAYDTLSKLHDITYDDNKQTKSKVGLHRCTFKVL